VGAKAGLLKGDAVHTINGRPIRDMSAPTIEAHLALGGKSLQLVVNSKDRSVDDLAATTRTLFVDEVDATASAADPPPADDGRLHSALDTRSESTRSKKAPLPPRQPMLVTKQLTGSENMDAVAEAMVKIIAHRPSRAALMKMKLNSNGGSLESDNSAA
jgi:hypothetical protein